MMQMNESEVMEEFRSLRDELSKWARLIDEQLNTFAQAIEPSLVENIQIPAKYRIKDDNSFKSKAFYRDKKYENPILEITDKVGTRLELSANILATVLLLSMNTSSDIVLRFLK